MKKYADTRLYGLDHLRALAITLVFLYHYRGFEHPAWIDSVMGFGWAGVDLFFVLSGFLISRPLFERLHTGQRIDLPSFYIKRFFRIIPPYLIVLALYFMLPAFREREALPPLWKFLTFTQNFGLDVIHKGTFSHAWSLCIEEQFYLLLPFTLLFFQRRASIRAIQFFIGFLFIATIGFRLISWFHFVLPVQEDRSFWLRWYQYLYYPTLTRLDGLLTGIAIAFAFEYTARFRRLIASKRRYIFPLAVLVIAIAHYLCRDQASFTASILGFSVVALGCGFLVIAAVTPATFLYKGHSRFTTLLANLSYTIYLSHKG